MRGRFVFLDIFRAVGPLLVFYSHIVVLYLQPNGLNPWPVAKLNVTAWRPLGLEEHVGWPAVVLFFLVSGFIVTHVGVDEPAREFTAKRIFRIYPVLAVTVLLVAALVLAGAPMAALEEATPLTARGVLTNVLLLNWVMIPQVKLVPVAWTLIIEMIFYTLLLVALPVLRRAPVIGIVLELGFVGLVLVLARQLGAAFFLFAVSVSYLPVLLLGQIAWAVWRRRITAGTGLLLGAASWTLFAWALSRDMGHGSGGYAGAVLLGLLLFVALLLAEPHLPQARPVRFLADRSYSIYLLHLPVAFPVMALLHERVPTTIVVLGGVAATMTAVELSFRFIERPAQAFVRRWPALRPDGVQPAPPGEVLQEASIEPALGT